MGRNGSGLEGKVAIVTGAAGGIGAATARALAEAGARVVLADLRDSALTEVHDALRDEGLDVARRVADISDEASVEALIAFTLATFGRLDAVDNNAALQGLPEDGLVGAMSASLWDRIMETNARGTMLMCKHALPALIDAGGGSIVNVTSGTAQAGDLHSTAYACSKGAIQTLTRYVATQYGERGVRCNAIALGLVMTPRLEASLPPPVLGIFQAHKLVGRIGRPRDVAEVVCFLASDEAAWITGQIIPVDGGFFAHVPTTVEMTELAARSSRAAAHQE